MIDFIIARGGRESPCVSYRDRDVLSNNSGTFNDNNTTSSGRKVVVQSLVDSMQAPFYAFTSWEKPDEECRHNDTLCSARVPCTANYSAHM